MSMRSSNKYKKRLTLEGNLPLSNKEVLVFLNLKEAPTKTLLFATIKIQSNSKIESKFSKV